MSRPLFALLGRKDEPTDAVEEYCTHLGESLASHGFRLEIRRVPWELHGWPHSLHALKLQAANWRDTWVLVQYTALAWSTRGFPFRFLQALRILAAARARIAVVFHDVEPFSGSRAADRIRRLVQLHTMRRAVDLADLAVFTVPVENISWLKPSAKCVFLPVGPNLPARSPVSSGEPAQHKIPAIAVFSITGGDAGARETREIISAARAASQAIGRIRLCIFGRHAELRETALRDALAGLPVDLSVEGVLEGPQIIERLSSCDALLFVRGPLSARRSSAIAGIACGLPVVAYSGRETAPPITEAGVQLVPFDQDSSLRQDQLNSALLQVLSDSALRSELAARSRQVYEQHFCWPSIASRFSRLLVDA